MSYSDGNYNGKIYIGHVKWNNDYKHVMDFGSAATRDSFLRTHLTEQKGKIGLVPSPNGYIDLDGVISGIENKNYLYYCNSSDIGNTYYCCFITNYEILAKKTTRVFVELDIFQQYFYSSSYYRCILERAHISKNEDNNNWKNYTAPEPVGYEAEIDSNISIFKDIDFSPQLVLDSLSLFGDVQGSGDNRYMQYTYGGRGSDENSTGYFRISCNYSNLLRSNLYYWSFPDKPTGTNNHYSDIIGFSFIPKWLKNKAEWSVIHGTPSEFSLYALDSDNVEHIEDPITITYNSLASGYSPTNKKLFTSLANVFKIWNKNGLSVVIKPEMLNDINNLTLKVWARPMSIIQRIEIINYKDLSCKFTDFNYSYSIPFGINTNTGVAQQNSIESLRLQGSLLKETQNQRYAQGLANIINSGLNSSNAAMNGNIAGGLTGAGNLIFNAIMNKRLQDVQVPLENYSQAQNIANAYSSIPKTIGNNSEKLSMNEDFITLRLAKCSPTAENCRIIDDFLTVYGYAIQEIKNPSSFFRTRPLFNYIKTNNCNLSALCPTDFENILKNIFNSGVTLWHYSYNNNTGYNNFGNYDLDNF